MWGKDKVGEKYQPFEFKPTMCLPDLHDERWEVRKINSSIFLITSEARGWITFKTPYQGFPQSLVRGLVLSTSNHSRTIFHTISDVYYW
jgi:hypothetical protein